LIVTSALTHGADTGGVEGVEVAVAEVDVERREEARGSLTLPCNRRCDLPRHLEGELVEPLRPVGRRQLSVDLLETRARTSATVLAWGIAAYRSGGGGLVFAGVHDISSRKVGARASGSRGYMPLRGGSARVCRGHFRRSFLYSGRGEWKQSRRSSLLSSFGGCFTN